MFAGAYLGNAIGGAGTLKLTRHIDFNMTFVMVAVSILAVTLTVTLWLREARTPRPVAGAGDSPLGFAAAQVGGYFKVAFSAFFGNRLGFLGLLFALLPAGAYALSLALQSNLAVELGLSDDDIASLSLYSTVLAAAGCVAGGWISDRFGRRRMIAVYMFATALPTLWLAWHMSKQGWIMPVDPSATRPETPAVLLAVFWAATLIYSFLNGLMYGTRTALFMDLCNPAVAATQFTAYMSMLNLTIAYSAAWQGAAITRFGYPTTLLIDAIVGCLSLLLLPWLASKPRPAVPLTDDELRAAQGSLQQQPS